MGDRLGGSGPPGEAYSRVARDLAVVTAASSAFLDELPGGLQATCRCGVRALHGEQEQRLKNVHPSV